MASLNLTVSSYVWGDRAEHQMKTVYVRVCVSLLPATASITQNEKTSLHSGAKGPFWGYCTDVIYAVIKPAEYS